MRPCAFPGCPNGADPRWGGYCDGHGAATPEQLIGRSVVEMGHLREQLAAMTEAAGNATDERDACEARAEKAEADLAAAKAVFADAMRRADEVGALRAEVTRLRETLRAPVVAVQAEGPHSPEVEGPLNDADSASGGGGE